MPKTVSKAEGYEEAPSLIMKLSKETLRRIERGKSLLISFEDGKDLNASLFVDEEQLPLKIVTETSVDLAEERKAGQFVIFSKVSAKASLFNEEIKESTIESVRLSSIEAEKQRKNRK